MNKDPRENGEHEVHLGGCERCADDRNRIYLGFFENCEPALSRARRFYNPVNGCRLCCRDCHLDKP